MHRPYVSIGMPVYNGGRFLERAIETTLAQDFDDLELVISDNGSTDATEEICRSYVATDPRVRYHRLPENRGAAPAGRSPRTSGRSPRSRRSSRCR